MYTLLWVEYLNVYRVYFLVGGVGVLKCKCRVYSIGWELGGVLKCIEYTLLWMEWEYLNVCVQYTLVGGRIEYTL